MMTRPTRNRATKRKCDPGPNVKAFKEKILPDPYQRKSVFTSAEVTGGFVKCGNGYVRGKAKV